MVHREYRKDLAKKRKNLFSIMGHSSVILIINVCKKNLF